MNFKCLENFEFTKKIGYLTFIGKDDKRRKRDLSKLLEKNLKFPLAYYLR